MNNISVPELQNLPPTEAQMVLEILMFDAYRDFTDLNEDQRRRYHECKEVLRRKVREGYIMGGSVQPSYSLITNDPGPSYQ